MNLGEKQGLDALLKDWPGPFLGGDKAVSAQDDERMWDERADIIAKAAQDQRNEKTAPEAGLDALLAAPALAPEPGESGVVLLSGKKTMTEDKEADSTEAHVGEPVSRVEPAGHEGVPSETQPCLPPSASARA